MKVQGWRKIASATRGRPNDPQVYSDLEVNATPPTGSTAELAPGEVGEICLAGPAVMLGYLDDPQATAAVLKEHEDGRVKAFVALEDPDSAGPELGDELIRHCREHLIKWSYPRDVEFRRELPKMRVGKIDFTALLESERP
jgi:acyl-CoA synthetase (AMP-forming)/AMP-acid ligase II